MRVDGGCFVFVCLVVCFVLGWVGDVLLGLGLVVVVVACFEWLSFDLVLFVILWVWFTWLLVVWV